MNKIKLHCIMFLLSIGLLSSFTTPISYASAVNNDSIANTSVTNTVDETRNKAGSVNFEDLVYKAKKFSIPIAVTGVIIAGISFLIGAKKTSGSIIVSLIGGLILINFPEQIAGWFFAAIDSLMNALNNG